MYVTEVYDDGSKDAIIESFKDNNDINAVYKAKKLVTALRKTGKQAKGRYTMRLYKEA